jgi:hypothetical protein
MVADQQRPKIRYYLTISSYAGLVPGAKHYYGRIRWRDKLPKAKEPRCETLEENLGWGGFKSKKSLIKAALQWFKKNAGPEDVLVLGGMADICAFPVLAGPKELIARAHETVLAWEKAYPPDGSDARDWPAADKAADDWRKIFTDYT